jgi:hypothetical protein
MSKDYSENELFKFLGWLADTGQLKRATALSRRASSKKMLEIAQPEERQDLRKVDVDDLSQRFENRASMKYKPHSLQVYKSRFKSALDDFLRHAENPSSFKPSVGNRSVRPTNGAAPKLRRSVPPPTLAQPPLLGEIVFPVPLRPGLTVNLVNIPPDLTAKEAEKISAIVMALAEK